MISLNKVMIMGYATSKAAITITSNGKIGSLKIASNERYRDKNGDVHTTTEYHNIVVYNSIAEIVSEYVNKGTALYIEGKLRTEKYADKEGISRFITKIVCYKLQILTPKNSDNSQQENAEEHDEDIEF